MAKPSYVSGSAETALVGETIGAHLERIAAAHPKREALVVRHQGVRWTWSELDRRVDALAAGLGVNRTTIISHLDRRGVNRRKSVRKMTDGTVSQAAKQYTAGASLKAVASRHGVDARTIAREFIQARIPIRARRGWPPRP